MSFRKAIVVAAVAAGAVSSPAMAGSPWTGEGPSAPIWQGLYVGANIGASWSRASGHETSADPFNGFDFERLRSRNETFTGGGQIGYNVQWGHIVAGIEADFNYVDHSNSATSFSGAVSSNTSGDFTGTVRPRLGFAAGPWLLYGTAGLAYGNVQTTISSNLGDGFTASSSEWRTGWVAGGGIEYAISKNWSLKTEYLHTDLGGSTASATSTLDGNTYSWRTRAVDDAVRFGINYRF